MTAGRGYAFFDEAWNWVMQRMKGSLESPARPITP